MTGLAFLIPIALGMGLLGLVAFLWSMKDGQYEDMDGAANRQGLAPIYNTYIFTAADPGYDAKLEAQQMLFRPLHPKKILGFTWQGLFLRRQQEVAADYADLISRTLLTPSLMMEELFRGPMSEHILALLQRHQAVGPGDHCDYGGGRVDLLHPLE